MGNITAVIGLGVGLVQQAFGMGYSYQAMQQQKQMMQQQQYAQVQQHCPDSSIPKLKTINGQQFYICPAPSNH